MTKSPDKLWSKDFILLSLSMLQLSIAFYFLLPTLPIFAIDVLGVENSQVGLIIAIFTLSALLIRPFAGIAVDLLGRKWILIISAILFSLLFIGYKWALLFVPLLIMRFLHGLQWGVSTSAYFTAAVDIIPLKKRARGIGYFGLAFNIAMAVGPALGLLIMKDDRYELLFYSGLALSFMGSLFLFLVKFPRFIKPPNLHFSWNGLFAKRTLPVSFNILLISSTFGGIITFLAIYAREQGLESFTGIYFTLMAVGMGLARILSGQIFDRFGPGVITLVGILLAVSGFWLLAAIPQCSCFLISGFTIGGGIGIVIPGFQTMANNVVKKERRGVANSTFLMGLDLGIGLGGLYTGLLADLFSLSIAFKVASLVLIIGLIVFLVRTLPHYNTHLISE